MGVQSPSVFEPELCAQDDNVRDMTSLRAKIRKIYQKLILKPETWLTAETWSMLNMRIHSKSRRTTKTKEKQNRSLLNHSDKLLKIAFMK